MRSRRSVALLASVAALVLVPLLAGCGSSSSAEGGLTVNEATIDEPANPQQGAMRLVIRNDGAKADALTGASSPLAKRATIHRTVTDAEGRSSMEMVSRLAIPAGGRVTFDPSTYHVMLEGFEKPLKVGDDLPVTFTFQKAGKRKVTARVVEPGSAHEEHDMDHSHG